MVGMDSWCPSCRHSVEPGSRFCVGCGRQFAAGGGGSAAQSSTVTMLSPGPPFPGYAAPPLSAPLTATPPPSDHRMSPSAGWQQAGPPVPGAYPPGGQYPQDSPYPGRGKDETGGQYPGPYGNGQRQFPPGQFGPGRHRRSSLGSQWLLGKLPFNSSLLPVAVAVAVAIGIFLVLAGAHALS